MLKRIYSRIRYPQYTYQQLKNCLLIFLCTLDFFYRFTKKALKYPGIDFQLIKNAIKRSPEIFLNNQFHQSIIPDFEFHYSSQQFKLKKQLKYKKYLSLISDYSMVTAHGAMSLLDITEYLEQNNIKGVFIEMGCWRGGMSALMAMNSSNRDIWLFDSFEGIPNLRKEDFDGSFEFEMKTKLNKGELKPIGALEASLDNAQYAMQNIAKHPLKKTHYAKGWFQDTLPKYASEIKDIALLRLDGDLYESYMVSLEALWDKVVPGGFVIIDDFALGGCRKAIRDFFKQKGIDPYLHNVDFTVKVIQKN